jgi:D-3-phosphoglycerate dehydrogenase
MKILITDMRHASAAEERKVLEPMGVEVDTTFCADEEDLIRNGRGAVGLLVSCARVSRRVLEALPGLKVVVKYGVGVDNIDIPAARSVGVAVANVPDYCVQEVALRRPSSVCLGLLGFGRIARQLASYAAPMVSRTVFFDPHVQSAAAAAFPEETIGMVGGAALQRGRATSFGPVSAREVA